MNVHSKLTGAILYMIYMLYTFIHIYYTIIFFTLTAEIIKYLSYSNSDSACLVIFTNLFVTSCSEMKTGVFTSNGSHVTVLSMFSRSLKMENSHKKELNISGRKKNESFPFTFFFSQITVTCAVDFITQQLWTSEEKKDSLVNIF